MEVECPVCMERTVDDRSPVRSFACSHVICNKCDDQLFVRADDRCPTCRAPRTEESKARQMLDGASALRRSQAMMERAENNPQPLSVFFPSVPVEELTVQHALLIRSPSRGEDEARNGFGLMVAASDHPIMQDPAIQHDRVVLALFPCRARLDLGRHDCRVLSGGGHAQGQRRDAWLAQPRNVRTPTLGNHSPYVCGGSQC